MKSVTITIPVYNEERIIKQSVQKLHSFCKKNISDFDWEIIIANNGSSDATKDIAIGIAKNLKNVSLVHSPQKGKGRILMQVWGKSNSDISVYLDADLSTDLDHLPPIINVIAKNKADIAVGSRNLSDSKVTRSLKRSIVSKSYMRFLKFLFQVNFTDAQCGFKATSKESISKLFPLINPKSWDKWNKTGSAWFWDSEFMIIGSKLGLKIYEEPIKWTEDPSSSVKVLKDSVENILGLWRIKMSKPWNQ